MLNEMIRTYQIHASSIPVSGNDDVIGILLDEQSAQLLAIKDQRCSAPSDVLAKLHLAVGLIEQAYAMGSHPIEECGLLERVLLDVVRLRNHCTN